MDTTTPLAALRGASKRYGGRIALDGLDLALHAGQVTSLLGANGAGKSTAVGLLLGLLRADAGEVQVLGAAPGTTAVRRQCGTMLQSAGIPERLTVGEVLALVRSGYSRPRSTAECVAIAGLDGLLGRRYGALSGGQQRRLQFALAICGRPRLLFLDEPTTGLDIGARQALWAAVRQQVDEGCAVLLTTHYLEEAEALSDRVAVIDAGRLLVEGSTGEIRARVSLRRIHCISSLAAALVAQWPGVREARREGEALLVVAEPAEPVVARLLQADPDLRELEIRRAGLADAFLALTTPQLAEAA
jgi:ABC-2 type transport system ATP-binding protein